MIPYFKQHYTARESGEYDRIIETLNRLHIEYLDLHGKFDNIDNKAWRLWKNDFIHPSVAGREKIARQIYAYLETRDYIRKLQQ